MLRAPVGSLFGASAPAFFYAFPYPPEASGKAGRFY
jgi:hypothetical protein